MGIFRIFGHFSASHLVISPDENINWWPLVTAACNFYGNLFLEPRSFVPDVSIMHHVSCPCQFRHEVCADIWQAWNQVGLQNRIRLFRSFPHKLYGAKKDNQKMLNKMAQYPVFYCFLSLQSMPWAKDEPKLICFLCVLCYFQTLLYQL